MGHEWRGVSGLINQAAELPGQTSLLNLRAVSSPAGVRRNRHRPVERKSLGHAATRRDPPTKIEIQSSLDIAPPDANTDWAPSVCSPRPEDTAHLLLPDAED